MKISCPHCSRTLEFTPDVLASLQGQPHVACPVCHGLMALPDAAPPPSRPAARRPQPAAKTNPAAMQAHRGLNRNMLVFGTLALLTLGGIGIFLASRNGGNIFNIFNNITNQIIHNSYFTQLIANGVTTEKDLQAIAEIRPFGDGFIGVSKAVLDWPQARGLARRTGSAVLSATLGDGDSSKLVEWLREAFRPHLASTAWLQAYGEARLLAGSEVLAVRNPSKQGRVLLHWNTSTPRSGLPPPPDALAFGISHYAFVPGVFTWKEAKTKAEAMGGHLAILASREEDEWVRAQFNKLIPRLSTGIWLGGESDSTGKTWHWVSGAQVEYEGWKPGEPNGNDRVGRAIAPPYTMSLYHAVDGKIGWNDSSEGDWLDKEKRMLGFLVEWDE